MELLSFFLAYIDQEQQKPKLDRGINGIAANIDNTSVSLNGVMNGEVTSVAIIEEFNGRFATKGSDKYKYNSLL
jgi:hypothetical protein